MTNKQALELAILDYENNLKTDENNQWVKKVLKGLKEVKQELEKLEKDNQKLRNAIISLELDTCIPELRKENSKLKKAIKIFKSFKIILKDDGNELYTLKFAFDIYGLTPEEYNILKETLYEN